MVIKGHIAYLFYVLFFSRKNPPKQGGEKGKENHK